MEDWMQVIRIVLRWRNLAMQIGLCTGCQKGNIQCKIEMWLVQN